MTTKKNATKNETTTTTTTTTTTPSKATAKPAETTKTPAKPKATAKPKIEEVAPAEAAPVEAAPAEAAPAEAAPEPAVEVAPEPAVEATPEPAVEATPEPAVEVAAAKVAEEPTYDLSGFSLFEKSAILQSKDFKEALGLMTKDELSALMNQGFRVEREGGAIYIAHPILINGEERSTVHMDAKVIIGGANDSFGLRMGYGHPTFMPGLGQAETLVFLKTYEKVYRAGERLSALLSPDALADVAGLLLYEKRDAAVNTRAKYGSFAKLGALAEVDKAFPPMPKIDKDGNIVLAKDRNLNERVYWMTLVAATETLEVGEDFQYCLVAIRDLASKWADRANLHQRTDAASYPERRAEAAPYIATLTSVLQSLQFSSHYANDEFRKMTREEIAALAPRAKELMEAQQAAWDEADRIEEARPKKKVNRRTKEELEAARAERAAEIEAKRAAGNASVNSPMPNNSPDLPNFVPPSDEGSEGGSANRN